MLTCCLAGLAILAASLLRGEWNEFGAWIAGVPFHLKHFGRRRAFLTPWLLPSAAAYAVTIAGSIFWGLRRVEYRRARGQ
jgi:hypothetical protein